MKAKEIKLVIISVLISFILSYLVLGGTVTFGNNTLNSKGKLVYNNGTDEIIIDTSDIETLQATVDSLSEEVKNLKIQSGVIDFSKLKHKYRILGISPVNTTGKTYTIQEDGWIQCYIVSLRGVWGYVSVNNIIVASDILINSSDERHAYHSNFIPVKKGDIVKAYANANSSSALSEVSVEFYTYE